jgi:chemotaxis family two-component system response regulator Rcp1
MSSNPTAPARILIIEDNPADVRLLRYALDQQGDPYILEVFRDGEQAITFVREQQTVADVQPEPCAIILDLHLPKYDGFAVLRAIKTDSVLAGVHVIAVTGLVTPQEESEVRAMGVRLYRTKPLELDEWIELGREIFEICGEFLARAA